MRFVLIIVAVLALVWLLGATRRRGRGDAGPERDKPAGPRPMLACTHCGVHLPRDEALPGRGGVFCSEAHREAYERSHPSP